MTNKTLCLLSLLVVSYFSLLFLNSYFIRIDIPVLGAIQELITLPALLLQAFLLVVAAKRVSRTRVFRDAYLLTSLSSLSLGTLGIVGSFTLAFLGYSV